VSGKSSLRLTFYDQSYCYPAPTPRPAKVVFPLGSPLNSFYEFLVLTGIYIYIYTHVFYFITLSQYLKSIASNGG
jgi:hypothetical protein